MTETCFHTALRYVLVGGGAALAMCLAALAAHLIMRYWLDVSLADQDKLNKKQLERLRRDSYWDREI